MCPIGGKPEGRSAASLCVGSPLLEFEAMAVRHPAFRVKREQGRAGRQVPGGARYNHAPWGGR
jgi:hypothetical protein